MSLDENDFIMFIADAFLGVKQLKFISFHIIKICYLTDLNLVYGICMKQVQFHCFNNFLYLPFISHMY